VVHNIGDLRMIKIPKNRVPVSIAIPFDLLVLIDENANKQGCSRSDYVVQALKDKVELDKN
jgi:metal-responsive CopG/Arc/MetJ family transcriptional regulator